MPRVKRKPSAESSLKMPQGFYLQKGIWYKRILKPDPETGVWQLRAESTSCKADQGQQAIDYINHRVEELEKTKRLRLAVDPGKVTMNQLFDDFLASVPHDPTRKNYEGVMKAHVRPFFGHRLAAESPLTTAANTAPTGASSASRTPPSTATSPRSASPSRSP